MKRCPQCKRSYSDFMDTCPQCKIPLAADSAAAQSNHVQTNQVQTNRVQTNQVQTNHAQRPDPAWNQQNVNSNNNQQIYTQNGGYVMQNQVGQPSSDSKMGFVEAVKSCFSQYATFTGRARRSEYWWFALLNYIASFVLMFLSQIIPVLAFLYFAWSIAVLVPGLAVWVRRLHDVGKDWKYMFWILVPIYGPIKMILTLTKDSDPGSNMYGSYPK